MILEGGRGGIKGQKKEERGVGVGWGGGRFSVLELLSQERGEFD